MKTKLLSVVLSVLALTSFLVGAASAQGPDTSERPRGRRAVEKWKAPPSEVAASLAAQEASQNVSLVGHIGGSTFAVAVQGGYAYIGVGPRLVILNISDPAHPAF
ncbi:MAG: hypothetical protein ACUVTG_13900, partial [Candidatus Oleimicrobiaceae bacterium]